MSCKNSSTGSALSYHSGGLAIYTTYGKATSAHDTETVNSSDEKDDNDPSRSPVYAQFQALMKTMQNRNVQKNMTMVKEQVAKL